MLEEIRVVPRKVRPFSSLSERKGFFYYVDVGNYAAGKVGRGVSAPPADIGGVPN